MANNIEELRKLPIHFEKDESSVILDVDERFMNVKVWIAHTGENRNRSIFSKELLESMIPSLANIPILGYIAVDSETDEPDFLAHEEKLVIENNEFKLKYLGRAYGMIPKENNAHFEYRYGEDGVEREYLVCNGIIWRKFPEVEEIFDRDGGFKNQSMELLHSSIEGEKNDEGLFVFEKAKFEGACLLGENVTPAMVSSTIERFSFADKLQEELKEMLIEFNAHFSATKEKGDETVTKQTTEFTEENSATEPETTEPVATEPEGNLAPDTFENEPATEPETTEPTESAEPAAEPETDSDFAKKDEEEEEDEDEKDKDDDKDEDEDEKKKFTRTFELAHDDIRSGLYNALDQHDSFQNSWVWISKVYDSHAIVEDEGNGKFFKVNYVKHESAVELGEFEEIFPMWVNQAEQSAIEISRNNFTALEQEVGELRVFKSGIELSEKEGMLSRYAKDLTEDEFNTIKEGLSNFSVADIEKEIGFILLKKNHFSAQESESTTTRVSAVNATESNPYGSASIYFTKN